MNSRVGAEVRRGRPTASGVALRALPENSVIKISGTLMSYFRVSKLVQKWWKILSKFSRD